MAEQTVFDTTVSKEGRVVIPAEFRRALGVAAGDVVHLILEGKELRMTTARSLLLELWAMNAVTGDGDAVADVRAFRNADREKSDARFETMMSAPVDPRSEDERADDLLAKLGLSG